MKNFLTAAVVCLTFASCAPSTPQARIQENPGKFAALSATDKAAVQSGKIVPGMSADAVLLAWGPPSNRFEGSSKNKITERWDYSASRPIYSNNFYGGFGGGFGGFGGFGNFYGRGNRLAYAIGPEVAYVPYRIASVWFVNRRVDSWERASGEATMAQPIGW